MRNPKSLAAFFAFGLAIVFAAESHAGQIPLASWAPGQHFPPAWNHSPYPSNHRGWGLSHRPAYTHWNLRNLLKEYGRSTQTPWGHGHGFGGPDWNLALPKPNGHNHFHLDFAQNCEPETEILISESVPEIRLDDPEVPAIPEPDTLVLLGAGVLGLIATRHLAVRRLAKRR